MSNVLPWEHDQEQNYSCMRKIVTDITSKGLRRVFKQEWNTRYQAMVGAWDDTNSSGQQLYHWEKSRPKAKDYLTKYKNGNTSEWDCSVLFDAILYSNSIGKMSLNPMVKDKVDKLREIRNEIMHVQEGKLTDSEFQNLVTGVENSFKILGLSTDEIRKMVTEKNRYNSFHVLPPRPTHDVVYREEKISEIIKYLDDKKNEEKLTNFYISGNPGSGKSQLASQVCERIYKIGVNWQTERTFVMTLNAKNLSSLLYSYEEFCRRLNCDESALENILRANKPMEEKIKDLRFLLAARIKNWPRWLLIVDNVEDLSQISPLLPQTAEGVWCNGQIIITTQNKTSIPPDSDLTKHIELSGGMSNCECCELLSLLSGTKKNDPLLHEVAERLDRQPLALAAAAVYVKQALSSNYHFSWTDYLLTLKKGERDFTEEQFLGINAAYNSTMSAAVLLAVEKSIENNAILKNTFEFFSWISFEPLPRDMIVIYNQKIDKDLDEEEICIAVNQCSLFLPSGNEDIRVHRVVHDAIKILYEKKTIGFGHLNKGRRVDDQNPFRCVLEALTSFEALPGTKMSVGHLKAFVSRSEQMVKEDDPLIVISTFFERDEISEIYMRFGRILCEHCEYQLSLTFQKAIFQVWSGLEDNISTDGIYDYCGDLFLKLGELEKAKHYHEKQHEISKGLFPPNAVDIAVSYDKLGTVYHDLRNLEEAKNHHEKALKIRENRLGSEHVDVAASYNNLANVYRDLGNLEEAKELYEKALKIFENHLGSEHVDVAASYNNLGLVYRRLGKFKEAKSHLEKATKIFLDCFGSEHVDVAQCHLNLAIVYRNLRQFRKAKNLQEKALKILENRLGYEHIIVATSYSNLANVYHDLGKLQEAKILYEKALKIRKNRLGSEHVDVADSCNNLGRVYRALGKLEEAKNHHEKALEIRERLLGSEHVDVAASYSNLANVYRDFGKLQEAKILYEKALKIRQNLLGSEHLDVADSCSNLGRVYRGLGKLEEAKDHHEKALEIREKLLGSEHVDVQDSCNILGRVHSDLGKWQEAKNLYEKASKISLSRIRSLHVDMGCSISNVPFFVSRSRRITRSYQSSLFVSRSKRITRSQIPL